MVYSLNKITQSNNFLKKSENYLDLDELPDDWKTRENYLHCFNVYKAKDKKIGYRRWKNENK